MTCFFFFLLTPKIKIFASFFFFSVQVKKCKSLFTIIHYLVYHKHCQTTQLKLQPILNQILRKRNESKGHFYKQFFRYVWRFRRDFVTVMLQFGAFNATSGRNVTAASVLERQKSTVKIASNCNKNCPYGGTLENQMFVNFMNHLHLPVSYVFYSVEEEEPHYS